MYLISAIAFCLPSLHTGCCYSHVSVNKNEFSRSKFPSPLQCDPWPFSLVILLSQSLVLVWVHGGTDQGINLAEDYPMKAAGSIYLGQVPVLPPSCLCWCRVEMVSCSTVKCTMGWRHCMGSPDHCTWSTARSGREAGFTGSRFWLPDTVMRLPQSAWVVTSLSLLMDPFHKVFREGSILVLFFFD